MLENRHKQSIYSDLKELITENTCRPDNNKQSTKFGCQLNLPVRLRKFFNLLIYMVQ